MEGGDRANFEGRACQEKRELLRAEYLFAKGQDEVWEAKINPKSLCEEPMFHTACSRHLSHSNCLSLCVFVIHPCVCVAQAQNHPAGLQKESTHVGGGGGRRSGLCLHVACHARARSSLRRLTGYYGYSLL